jgi:hypothetical protein
MIQLYAAIGGAILVAGLGGALYTQTVRLDAAKQEKKVLLAEVAAAERSRKAAVKAASNRAAEAAIAQEQARVARKALDEALQGPAKEWADQPVPQEVLDALR